MYTNTDYNIHGAIPLLFISPCWIPFAPLSNPLHLLGNPPSCDRIRPPWSQVAFKLTSPFPTLSPIPPPSKFPEPRLSSASLWRPQESGIFCPEQIQQYVFQSLYHFFDNKTAAGTTSWIFYITEGCKVSFNGCCWQGLRNVSSRQILRDWPTILNLLFFGYKEV